MIARIKSRKTLSSVLNYNQNKVNNGQAEILATNLIEHPNGKTVSVQNLINEFNTYLPSGINTAEPVIHISLNPHPEDNLDNGKYIQIAEEYMKRLGYGDQPYILYKHNDIQREHLHIVSLRVDRKGKRIKDSYEHLRSKKITEDLEKMFNLHPAQEKQRPDKIQVATQQPEEIKKQIQTVANDLIRKYSFQTLGELRSLLSLYHISLDEVKGITNGKPYHGLVYSMTNEKGEKITQPISSSQFVKYMGYKSLNNRMEKATENIRKKKLREKTKKKIDLYIKTIRSEQELKALLRDKQIEVIFRRNEEGRIYGTTFIDHENKTVFNGSRLGKEYSANFFNEKFNEPIKEASHPTKETSQPTQEIKPEVPDIPMAAIPHSKETESMWDGMSFNLIGFNNLSLPFIDQPKEEDVSYLYRKKKKKKRRPGRQD